MRGKSSTCRSAPIKLTVYDLNRSQTQPSEKLATASRRLAAHQRGRAIGAVTQDLRDNNGRAPKGAESNITNMKMAALSGLLFHLGVVTPRPYGRGY
jgi:hypothetical protein